MFAHVPFRPPQAYCPATEMVEHPLGLYAEERCTSAQFCVCPALSLTSAQDREVKVKHVPKNQVDPRGLIRNDDARALFQDQRRRHATDLHLPCTCLAVLCWPGEAFKGRSCLTEAVEIYATMYGTTIPRVLNVSQQLDRMQPSRSIMPCITPAAQMFLLHEGRCLTGRTAF